MDPLLRPGSLVMLDPSLQKVQNSGWNNEYERPILLRRASAGISLLLVPLRRRLADSSTSPTVVLCSGSLSISCGGGDYRPSRRGRYAGGPEVGRREENTPSKAFMFEQNNSLR